MNICFIGKHKYPKDILSNEQDMKTWRSLAGYFSKIFVIAESPDLFFHKAYEKNISIYLLPCLGFGYIGFIKQAIYLGLYLNWRYGVDVFDASEVAGGGISATILKFFTNKSTVVEVQGEIFRKLENGQNLKSRLLQRIGRYAMKKAARVRVISHAIFNQVREQGIPESKICLVSLRVDLNLFNQLSILRINSFGDKIGITLGYIGRLVDGKGLEDLFRAIAILKNQNLLVRRSLGVSGEPVAWSLVIYGTGPLETKLKKNSPRYENIKYNRMAGVCAI
ncbi:MAG: hypothetical protein Q7K16_04660 [Candidatus Azambacteria bacterium]|nr:hypothetical protein [Candidatus Azambacteria bacterium]